MQPDHQAILDQFLEMAAQCSTPECAEAHANRYREQYQQQIAYLDNVVLPIVAAFEARAEELRAEEESG